MISRTAILIVALILASPVFSFARNSGGEYIIHSYGTETCTSYLKLRKPIIDNKLVTAWVEGFITGYNYTTMRVSDLAMGKNIDDVMEKIDKYCANDPMNTLMNAMLMYVREVDPGR